MTLTLDATPPPPPREPAPYVYAATDSRPRTPREISLCETADHTDWVYMGGLVLSNIGSIWLDAGYLKFRPEPGVRIIGPATIGLAWGALLGGGYLALPKCSADWAGSPPPEGDVRPSWPLAITIAMVSMASAPIVVGTEQGPLYLDWSVTERSMRVLVPMATGFVGALVPYLLPPKTWRAAKEIERIRLSGTPDAAFLSYSMRF